MKPNSTSVQSNEGTQARSDAGYATQRVQMPKVMSISAPRGMEDYQLSARKVAVEVKFTYRINSTIIVNGTAKLTGWHKAATTKMVVWVHNPLSEEAALKAVREMERELGSTLRLIHETEDFLLPILTDIPLGFEIVGTPTIVQRPKTNRYGYIADHLAAVHDAWRRAIESFYAEIPAAA